MNQNNDWTIIGVFETVEEADKFCKIANKELINRGEWINKWMKYVKRIEEKQTRK